MLFVKVLRGQCSFLLYLSVIEANYLSPLETLSYIHAKRKGG